MNEETVNQDNTAAEQETRTFTQEELNSIVQQRVARATEKYADYDDMRQKLEGYDDILAKANKADDLQRQVDEMTQANSLRSIREKVAAEKNVPANLLHGDTEEECSAQADAILAFARPGYPAVKDGGEARKTGGSTTAQQFEEWFNQALR